MNPFEKIFNYQIVSRLENSGTFMVTGHERSWLKACLAHPASAEAFTPETLSKLLDILKSDLDIHASEHIQHKAANKVKHVYHPLIRQLRRAMMNKQLLQIDCSAKQDRIVKHDSVWPYKLEYSMVKREWYLLWFHARKHTLMSTRLERICAVEAFPCSESRYEELHKLTLKQLTKRKQCVSIQVVRMYNAELSRILYTFSCFEKDVYYDAEADSYSITVTFYGGESEFVLQKIRFLGKRVRVMDEGYMSNRMRESAAKALGRYSN